MCNSGSLLMILFAKNVRYNEEMGISVTVLYIRRVDNTRD